jgi:hypothetical protein
MRLDPADVTISNVRARGIAVALLDPDIVEAVRTGELVIGAADTSFPKTSVRRITLARAESKPRGCSPSSSHCVLA